MNPGDSDKSMKWIYPDQEPAPRGVKIALLTEGNIQTTGNWTDDGRYKAWQRLFSRDKEHERRTTILTLDESAVQRPFKVNYIND